MSGLHVSGILVQTRPEAVDRVQAELAALPGVEVHTATPAGRLITVVERDSDGALAAVLEDMQNTTGVLSAALVYHYSDDSEILDEEVTS